MLGMKTNENIFRIANSKLVRYPTWCGYLTPAEILALHEDGAVFSHEDVVPSAMKCMREGHSNPRWVYCNPGRSFRKPRHKEGTH